MATKPTYEELQKQVRELETEAVKSRQVEQSLQEKLTRFRELWDDAPIAYHVLDTRGIIKEVNHTEMDMLGYTKEEMVGKPIFDFVLPQQRQEAEERFRLKLAGDHISKQDDRIYIRKDGSNIHVSIDDRLEFGDDGKVSGIRTTMVDISQQKTAEEALRESEEKYRNVVERSNDGIVIVQDGVIKYANPSLAEMTGYETDEAIDTPFTKYIYPEEVEESVDFYRRRLAGEQLPSRYERALRHNDGSRIDTEIDAAVITYQGRPATLVIIRDITERKRAEEALKKSSEQIKLLAYSVSHDLKNPATGIYGLTKLLYKKYGDVLGEHGKKYCESILESSEQIAKLVGNINIYISTKEMPLHIETVQLTQLLQMVRDEFSAQLDIRGITWSQPESMPEINADRLSVLRILRNLVENALKHGGDDLNEVAIEYGESDAFHILSVSNDGLPIKLEDPENLFRPFQRQETSEGVEGSGLGLSIVKELTEQHGGIIRVESGPQKGVTFHISISRYL
jgi:PAS domain S-box-containing protein